MVTRALLSLPNLEIGTEQTIAPTTNLVCFSKNVSVYVVNESGKLCSKQEKVWCCCSKTKRFADGWKSFYKMLSLNYGEQNVTQAFNELAKNIDLGQTRLPFLSGDSIINIWTRAQEINNQIAQNTFNEFVNNYVRLKKSLKKVVRHRPEPTLGDKVLFFFGWANPPPKTDSGAGASAYKSESVGWAKMNVLRFQDINFQTIKKVPVLNGITEERLQQIISETRQALESEGKESHFESLSKDELVLGGIGCFIGLFEDNKITSFEQAEKMFEEKKLSEDLYKALLRAARQVSV